MESKIKEIITKIIGEEFTYSGEDMFEDGILDSIEMMELVTEIEATFNIELDAEDIVPENFKTITTITTLINKLKLQES